MINVLQAALSILPRQKLTYKKFLGRTSSEIGLLVNQYSDPIQVTGSIQPADADTLYRLGIANTGDIWSCWLFGDILSASQLKSNDVIIGEDGQEYNVFKSDDWNSYPNQNWNWVFIRRAKKYGDQ